MATSRDPKYFKTFGININDVDAKNRIKVQSLMNYMQEAAWNNAGALGLSTYDLLNKGITWVMNRISLEILALPGHLDEITIETWPSGMDKYFVYRDYRVLSANNEVIAKATSNWVVFDIKSRKLVSVPAFIKEADLEEERGNMQRVRGKVQFKEDNKEQDWPVRVGWYDLDLNGHVNNANYFKWLMDVIPASFHETHSIKSMDISFMSEGYLDEDLSIQSYRENEVEYAQRICNSAGDKTLITANTRFNKI